MVIVERTCEGCGHRFRVDRDQPDRFCSGYCSAQLGLLSVLAAVQQAAAVQRFAQTCRR
jgi:hypothetical protein